MKKIIAVVILVCITANLIGCETVAKKFRRKKKDTAKAPRMYVVKKYPPKPPAELYKKHYAYWASWQSEIIEVLGQNHKKDMRCIEEIIGNLHDMKNQLIQEKADELVKHIEKLDMVKDVIFQEELTTANRDYILRTLEREDRLIKKEYCFSKMKNYIKSIPDESEKPK